MVCVLRLLLMAGTMAGTVESKGGAKDQVTKEVKKSKVSPLGARITTCTVVQCM